MKEVDIVDRHTGDNTMKILDVIISIFLNDVIIEKVSQEKAGTPWQLRDLGTLARGHFRHFTLYNPLGLLSSIVFIGTAFSPWWYAKVHEEYYTINAYPFFLQHDLPSEGWSYVIETPAVAVVFLIILLASYLFLAVWGSTMAGRKGRFFLLAAGLFMVLYTVGFWGSLLFATHRVDQPVVGSSSVIYTVEVDIYMAFTRAYFVAIGAGIACMLSSLIHGKLRIPLYRKNASHNDTLHETL